MLYFTGQRGFVAPGPERFSASFLNKKNNTKIEQKTRQIHPDKRKKLTLLHFLLPISVQITEMPIHIGLVLSQDLSKNIVGNLLVNIYFTHY